MAERTGSTAIIVVDTSRLEEVLKKLGDKAIPILRDSLNTIGITGESMVKERTPVDTGRLRSSVSWKKSVFRPDEVRIGSNVVYAPFVIGDAPPFFIYPRKRRALRFKIGNRVIFARRVRHPGGRRILQDVAAELQRDMPAIVDRIIDHHLKDVK